MKRITALLVLAAAAAALPARAQAPAAGGAGGDRGSTTEGGRGRGGSGRRGFGRGMRQLSLVGGLPAAVELKLKLKADQKTKLEKIRTTAREQIRQEFQKAGGPGGTAAGPRGTQGGPRSSGGSGGTAGGGGGDKGAAGGPGGSGTAGGGPGGRRRGPDPAVFEKVRPIREKAETQAEALLKPDQKKVWDGLKADAKSYAGLDRLAMPLLAVDGLTADQKNHLKALATDMNKKRDTLFAGAGGAAAPRGAPAPGGDRRRSQAALQGIIPKYQALQKDADAGIRKILNPAQVKQFDAAKAAMPALRGRGGGGRLGRPFRSPGATPRPGTTL